jgi:predicted RNA-binding protein with PUA-like domain
MTLFDVTLKKDTWLVSRFSDEIKVGDIGLIWKARFERGIYAVGRITAAPRMMKELPESTKYWASAADRGKEAIRVVISYQLKLTLATALTSDELRKTPGLQNMTILQQSQGTNFRVKPSEWEIIRDLLKRKYNFEIV